MFKEITVIGGAGHVGLAFGLICTSKNIKVHLHDINKDSLDIIDFAIYFLSDKIVSIRP